MERLTDQRAVIEPGTYLVLDDLLDNVPEIQSVSRKELYYRLGLIENVLGKNYDLDRLRELIKAGREGRIDKIPSADVAPVVHAKWEHTHTSESYFNECWRCSACGFDDTEGFVFEFCPHCGAKMDLEESK